jgi:hypothetical protein
MHFRARTAVFGVACCLSAASSALAQVPARVDSLNRALNTLSGRIDSLEAGLCPAETPLAMPQPTGDKRTDSLAVKLQVLDGRVRALRTSKCNPPAAAPAQPSDTGGDLAAIRAAAARAAGQAPSQGADTSKPTVPAEPAPSGGGPRGANLLNPEISATGDVRLVARDHGEQNTAEAREFELALQSALDPYSNTKIFLTFEEEEVGVEEGYIYWTGLPGGLRVDVGKYRQQVGDLNRWHLHALPETEYPLVYQRFFATEGLSGVGVSAYTALPFSLAHATHEVWLQATTTGDQAFMASGNQPVLLGRLQNFWQLSRSTYAQLGFTGTGGNNNDADLRSRIVGLDFRMTYRPPEMGTRRDITFRAEGYRLHSELVGISDNRYGTFLDLQARTSQRWIFGARYDYVEAPMGPANTEWRLTPNITWWESEFVFLRLEGEHRHTDLEGSRNLLTFQAVWAMGPHKHETY